MESLKFFFIGALIVVLLNCCSLCQSYCTVYTNIEKTFLKNFLINITDENHTVSAFCKCTGNKPLGWWQLNSDGKYGEVHEDYTMTINAGGSEEMIKINYTVTESLILLCGNSGGDYSRAISIVIVEPQEECISNSSSDIIKQSSTVIQSSFTVMQSSSILFPFTQSSTNIDSTSLSSWSHEDSCTEWQTQTTTKTVEMTLTVAPTTLVSRIPQMTTTTSTTEIERTTPDTLISVEAGVGAAGVIIVVLVVIILVLLASLVVVIKKNKEYKVDDKSRGQGSSDISPLELLVAVNPAAVHHQLDTNDGTSNQHDSTPSIHHADEQLNTDNPSE